MTNHQTKLITSTKAAKPASADKHLQWPVIDEEVLAIFPPSLTVIRKVIRALGFVRARDFLAEHGGLMHNIPKFKGHALGLSADELARLRCTLKDHLDENDRVWLPKPDKLFIMVRNTQIRKDKSRMSIRGLAKAHQLSDRHILNICRETDDRQIDLF